MDIYAAFIILVILGIVGIPLGWGLLGQCVLGLTHPKQFFKGHLTNKEFDRLLIMLYSDKDLKFDGYRVTGGGYECWVANNMYGFSINGTKDFSAYQRLKFFYYWRKVLAISEKQKTEVALKKHLLTVNGKLLYSDSEDK